MTFLQLLRFVPGLGLALLGEIARWLVERPTRLIIVALIGLSVWLWLGGDHARDLAESRRMQAACWEGKFRQQKAEILKLVDIVATEKAEAARLDQANAERVNAVWSTNLEEVTHDYQAELAAVRAAVADRLRNAGQGSGAVRSAGGGAEAILPPVPILPNGPLRSGETAIVDAADIDACTVNTLKLEYLIDAWDRGARIDVNGP